MLHKNKIATFISVIVFTLALLLPVGVQFFHALEGHEHIACTDIATHLHEKKTECKLCDFHISKVVFTINEFSEVSIFEIILNPETHYSLSSKSFSFHKLAVRGPPFVS